MKIRNILFALFSMAAMAHGQEYLGTTVPMNNDRETDSLKKINKVLKDGATSGSAVTVTNFPATQSVVPVIGATSGASAVSSAALESSHVLKSSAGTLVGVLGINNSGSTQYVQLHDAASLPSNGAVPLAVFTVPAGQNFSLDIPLTGVPFTIGIVICNSSTLATKTIGSADCFFTAIVK